MAKNKLPGFIFYPKKWLEGSAEFSPAEKVIYIDLLSYQYEKGSLPSDKKRLARLVGLSQVEFDELWEAVGVKFVEISGNRLVNRTLEQMVNQTVVKEATKSATNTLTGTFASLIRKNPQLTEEHKKTLKSEFDITEYDLLDIKKETERLTEWFYGRLESIYINISIKDKEDKEGVGGKEGKGVVRFNQFPVAENFNGLPDIRIGSIIELVAITQKVKLDNEGVSKMWEVFKVQTLTGKKFYKDEGDVYSHFTNWMKYQKFKDNAGKSGTSSEQRANSNSKSAGAYQLLEQLKKENGHS